MEDHRYFSFQVCQIGWPTFIAARAETIAEFPAYWSIPVRQTARTTLPVKLPLSRSATGPNESLNPQTVIAVAVLDAAPLKRIVDGFFEKFRLADDSVAAARTIAASPPNMNITRKTRVSDIEK